MEQPHGLDELNRSVIAQGLCAACGACIAGGCPYLTTFRGKTVVLDRCTVEHGRCHQYCPMTFFDPEPVSLSVFGRAPVQGPLGMCHEVLASRAADDPTAQAGQGGGTVTSLLLMALATNAIDAAVLTRTIPGQPFPQGTVATSAEEISACSGSKYVGSHSLAALREALDRGFRRIAVVGVPCQVRSLRKMALYDLKNEDLKGRIALVVGLFCNWAFSGREFDAFLADRFGTKSISGFHIPPPPAGVIEVCCEDGSVDVPLDEVRPFIQDACKVCPDMTAEYADLSVGMYEGKPGWNTLITRTETGRGLVEQASSLHRLKVEPFPSENLEHLKAASERKRQRAAISESDGRNVENSQR